MPTLSKEKLRVVYFSEHHHFCCERCCGTPLFH